MSSSLQFVRNRLVASMMLVALVVSLLAVAPLRAQVSADAVTAKSMLSYQSAGHGLFFETGGWLISNASYALRVKFLGANPVTPQSREAVQSAATPAALSQVTYANLWNGVSLSYDAPTGTIARSTYTLEPGADPALIRLDYNAPASVQADGTLMTHFASGTITESAPVAWQDVNGQRVSVDVSFLVRPDQSIGFQLGAYDPSFRLYIDPAIAWNTFFGSDGNDYAYAVQVDASDNIYIAGHSMGTWGTPIIGFHTGGSAPDAFVAKLSSSGNLVWNTFLGSDSTGGYDMIRDLVLDASGNIYVAGQSPADWQGVSAPVVAHHGSSDAFVAQLDNSGALQWHTFLGGSNMDNGFALVRDSSGNLYVTGNSYASWGSPLRAFTNGYDVFVAKVDSSGGLVWNSFLGGSGTNEYGNDIAMDGSGNIYVVGDSDASWSPASGYVGGGDVFVAKMDSAGAITWAKFFGSSLNDNGLGIAVDGSNNIYVSGLSQDTWGSPVHAHNGAYTWSTFLAKFDSSMTRVWNTFYYGDLAATVLVDGSNVSYTGYTNTTFGSPTNPFQGGSDAFVATMDGTTGALVSNTFVGGSGGDQGFAFTKNSQGSYVVVGTSYETWGSPINAFVGCCGAAETMVAMTGSLTNANLSGINLSVGSLSPSFAAGTTSYSASVPYATTGITVTPAAEGSIQVKVNSGSYATVTSGSASGTLSLNPGANTVSIRVTAADGVTTKTYTVSVTRDYNNDANLTVLMLSTGSLSPSFDSGTTSYTTNTLYANSSLSIAPTLSDSNASVQVRVGAGSWVNVTSGTSSSLLALSVGANTVEVRVVAQDSSTSKTYTITLTRGAASTVNTLGGLSLSLGSLSPVFDAATTTYTATVPNGTTSVTLTATRGDATQTLLAHIGSDSWISVTSGSASTPFALAYGPNTLQVRVTAEDSSIQTYTITVTRALSTVSSLGGLTIDVGTLSPAFATGTTSYTASAVYATTSLTVTPTKTDNLSSIQARVNGGSWATVTSGSASGALSLNVGANTVDILVTAQDATTTTYTVTFTRGAASTVKTLGGLSLSLGTLTPAFDAATTTYTATVPNGTTSVTVTPTQSDATQTIEARVGTGAWATVTSGSPSSALALDYGPNTVEVRVTAEDATARTYTITVTRALSTVSSLGGLTIDVGTLSPAFDTATTSYTASALYATSSLMVTPTKTDGNATIRARVNGGSWITVTSGSASSALSLNVGANTVEIQTTAQDGTTITTYTITFTRGAASTNAKLGGLSISIPGLSPAFDPNVYSYTASAENLPGTFTVTPTSGDGLATIRVRLNGGTYTYITSGSASSPLTLAVGTNTVEITLLAEDGSATQTYTLTITRAAALSGITISAGTLTPTFDPTVTSYTADVNNAASTFTVTPLASGSETVIQAKVGSGSFVTVTSGAPSSPLTLAVGANTVTVKVSSTDGTVSITYTFVITRAPSTNANMGSISLSVGNLSPAFDPATTSYTASVLYATSSITVTPGTADNTATVRARVNGGSWSAVTSGSPSAGLALSVGDNTVEVEVTAQDGVTVVTYTFIITRQPASTNASMGGVSVSFPGLTPAFDPVTYTYTASVPSTTGSFTITPNSGDGTATIRVRVNGGSWTTLTSGSPSSGLTLDPGLNLVEIEVTAEDGVTTLTYTLTITRAVALGGINIGVGSLSPAFSPDVTTYSLDVPNSSATLTVTPQTGAGNSSVTVNGTPITNGSPSADVNLTVGQNTLTIVVTATDSVTTQTYTITVTRAAGVADISLGVGTISFDPDVTEYSTKVSNSTTELVVAITTSENGSTVDYEVNNGGYQAIPQSGAFSAPLTPGINTIHIRVTAADTLTQRVYNLTVTRALVIIYYFPFVGR